VTHIYAGQLGSINDGSNDLIVARDDGSIEIYNFDADTEPSLRYSINF